MQRHNKKKPPSLQDGAPAAKRRKRAATELPAEAEAVAEVVVVAETAAEVVVAEAVVAEVEAAEAVVAETVAEATALEQLTARRAAQYALWARFLAATEGGGAPAPRLARHLERGVFNHALAAAHRRALLVHPGCPVFWRLYTERARTVWRNLRGCPELLHSVRVGAVTAQELERMDALQLNKNHWRQELSAKTKRDDHRFETRLVANTTEFTCAACGSRQCSTFEVQLRSSDEPSTVFVTCVDCGERWRED
jgi:DNA-directed RNA polymerase subunit M/transcription elongation factor TFIIS